MRPGLPFLLAAAVLAGGLVGARVTAAPTARTAQDLPGGEAGARKATDAERKAVASAIEGQLKAFKADDYAKALTYQSSALREVFETPDDFRRAITQGYPQFANYKSITYGNASANPKGDRVAVQVTLTGEDRVSVKAVYLMLQEKGEYKVDGVMGGTRPKVPPKDEV